MTFFTAFLGSAGRVTPFDWVSATAFKRSPDEG